MYVSEFLQNEKEKGSMIMLFTVDLILEVKACMLLSFCRIIKKKSNPRISLLTVDLNPKVKVGVLVFAVGFSIQAELAQ